MSKQATPVTLTDEERQTLTAWARASATERRLADRAKMIVAAAAGEPTTRIARRLGTRPARVSKWRTRFAQYRLAGLADDPRPGARRKYDQTTEQRILAQLDEPPPAGCATWTGGLLATALGDVSADQVWRVLRRHGIHLQRRRSWCISTDPQVAVKAADIVGLYLDPPENAVVLCVDEKPHIQALERAQGWLRLPNGRALTGFGHEYKWHGTTTLFAAYPDQEIHVILDNLNTHKPKHDWWLRRHPHVHLHFTPTRATWLNLVECWFSILSRRALRGRSFTSPRALRAAITAFIDAYTQEAAPFEWRKRVVRPTPLQRSYSNLRN